MQISEWFLGIFILLFLADLVVEMVLLIRNEREVKRNPEVPDYFSSFISSQQYHQSVQYTLDRSKFERFALPFSAFLTVVILFSGILPWIDSLFDSWNPIIRGIAFLFSLYALQFVLKAPLSIYQTFVIEARHGFNNMTWGLFIADILKSMVLSILLGAPLLAAILWFIKTFPSNWWVWAYLVFMGFQILMLFLYPKWIAPLFNKFKPLEDGPVRERLLDLARRLNFSAKDLMIMDGSRRSAHSNAYFSGFGKSRRIVLFDTLIEQLSIDELESVLAHEVGHYKHKHIIKMFFTQSMLLLAGFFIMYLALYWEPLYKAFGFEKALPHVGLFLIPTVISTISIFLSPLFHGTSRKYEYQADAFAVKHTSAKAMELALVKLAKKNKSNLTPDKWYSAFHHSHPAAAERISAIRGLAKQEEK